MLQGISRAFVTPSRRACLHQLLHQPHAAAAVGVAVCIALCVREQYTCAVRRRQWRRWLLLLLLLLRILLLLPILLPLLLLPAPLLLLLANRLLLLLLVLLARAALLGRRTQVTQACQQRSQTPIVFVIGDVSAEHLMEVANKRR